MSRPYVPVGEFGFTPNAELLEIVREYRDEALADGWTIEPTYQHESVERAARLNKEGFVMSLIMREGAHPRTKATQYEASIHLWGPDGLCLEVPPLYSWEEIKKRLRRCGYCGKDDVDVERIGFAGRCCTACRPLVQPRVEFPGWCD